MKVYGGRGNLSTIRLRLHFFFYFHYTLNASFISLFYFSCSEKSNMYWIFFSLFYIEHFLLDTIYFIIFLSLYSKSLMRLVVRSIPPWIPCNLAFTYEIIFIFFFSNFFFLNLVISHLTLLFCSLLFWVFLNSWFKVHLISKNAYLEMFNACWDSCFIIVFLNFMFGFLENILIS